MKRVRAEGLLGVPTPFAMVEDVLTVMAQVVIVVRVARVEEGAVTLYVLARPGPWPPQPRDYYPDEASAPYLLADEEEVWLFERDDYEERISLLLDSKRACCGPDH